MSERRPPRPARIPVALVVAAGAACLALGLLGAIVWSVAPAATPLVAVPLVLSYAAFRAGCRGMRERDRMRTLYEAGRSLSGPLDETSFGPFLDLVEQLLGARTAELVVVEGDAVTIHDRRGSVALTAATPAGRGHRPEAYAPVRGGVSPQLALVAGPGEVRAVLAVYRPVELSAPERSLLDALAALVHDRLVDEGMLGEVERRRARVSDIIDHSPEGIFVVSPAGVIESWNPAMERITGSAAAQAVGRTWAEMFGRDAHPGRPGGAGEGAPDPAGDILLVRPDGGERRIRYRRGAAGDHDGGLHSEVVVARDVTAELESERLKADFVATVSHELRTPLTPLKGFLATLIGGTGEDDPAARREYYLIMQHQTDRLERLITDLLEVSRIEGGQMPVEARSIDVTALVEGQIADFTRQQPEREIRLRAPSDPVIASGDAFRVGQVVSNLLSNALKYSEPVFPVEVTVAPADRDQVIVSVRDEGEGIPLVEQERVFERFHRVEGHLTRRTGGTGLGLYIARQLVEAMHGRLWVISSPGSGSTFSFSLPAAPAAASAGEPDRTGEPAGRTP